MPLENLSRPGSRARRAFCFWHVKTVYNQQGTDCAVHLCEGRIYACPYCSVVDAKRCSDYKAASLEDQPR